MDEKDFVVQWYSGTGKGGQHRNKHQNCCRVVHRLTGISAVGTGSKSRETNKKTALETCKRRVESTKKEDTPRYQAGFQRVRTYHEPRNEVIDHRSGFKDTYKNVVEEGNLHNIIDSIRYVD